MASKIVSREGGKAKTVEHEVNPDRPCLREGAAAIMRVRMENAWELDDPPTVRGWRIVKGLRTVADRFPIAGSPSGKFAIRSYTAHQT